PWPVSTRAFETPLPPRPGQLRPPPLLPARGTPPGVPRKLFQNRGQPFTDRDERRSAPACAAQDEGPFDAGHHHFGKGPADGRVGPGELPRDRVDPSLQGLPADLPQRLVSGVEIQGDRADRAALVRTRA